MTPETADPSDFNVVVCDNLADLSEHQDSWNELYRKTRSRVPTVTYAWTSAYFEHRLHAKHNWICILAYLKGSLIGVLPLEAPRKQHQPPNRSTLRVPFDNHVYATDLLIDDDHLEATIEILLRGLHSAWPDYWSIVFDRVPENSPLLKTIKAWPGLLQINRATSRGAYVSVPKDFHSYRNALSKNFRGNLNKAKNKLKKEAGVTFEIIRPPTYDPTALDLFLSTEATGWKGRHGTAISSSVHLRNFYTTLTRRLARAGFLEWHFLKVNNHTIAANLAVHAESKLFIWKLGYDEAYAKWSPGSLLLEYVIREATQPTAAVREIDFLTDFAWYDNWRMNYRTYYSLSLFPKRPKPMLIGFLPRLLISIARLFYKRVRQAP